MKWVYSVLTALVILGLGCAFIVLSGAFPGLMVFIISAALFGFVVYAVRTTIFE